MPFHFGSACGMLASTSDASSTENCDPVVADGKCKLSCSLCRGEVSGWTIIDSAHTYLDKSLRCYEGEQCTFKGTYSKLQKCAQLEHPHSHPLEIDPTRQLDWENFQQSSEIIDVLSTIHPKVPHGVVFGDYVIAYGDDDSGDEFEDFPEDEVNWWTSCILYQVFDNFRNSRNR